MKDIIVISEDTLIFDGKSYKCAVGKNGFTDNKREGDWATPLGCFEVRKVFYRPDKLDPPQTNIGVVALHQDDGWCDDPSDRKYNQWVKMPYSASAENLWREDEVYDLIVELGFNDNPPVLGAGSAIFFHVARPTYSGTAGCVAVNQSDLLEILAKINPGTKLCVEPRRNIVNN